MALLADKEGFLIGEPVTVDTGRFAKAASIWKAIREDTLAIRRSLAGIKPPKAEVSRPQVAAAPSRSTRERNTPVRERARPAALPERNAQGRFVSKNPKVTRVPSESRDDTESDGFMRRLAGRVAEAAGSGVAQSVEGTDQIDPTLTAAKEVGGIVGPLLKPVGAAFTTVFSRRAERRKQREAAKENAKEQHKLALPWYKRLLGKKTPAASGEGGRSGFGGLIGSLLIRSLTGLFTPIVAAVGAITRLMPFLSKLSLPLSGMFAAVKGFNTTTEEYAARMGVELNGSLAQELAVRFVGVLGDLGNTLTFGLAEKFGQVLSDVLPKAFDSFVAFAKDSWQSAVASALDVKSKAGNYAADKWDAIKSSIGFGSAGNKAALEKQLDAAGITNKRERDMIMSQADHETGGFRNMEESFNYSPERLRQISSRTRGMSDAQIKAVTDSGPAGVAEFMYGGRNGNSEEGDGYRYRGRGYVQLTGRANYAAASKALGIDLVANPDFAAVPDVAAKIATWYNQSRGLTDAARRGDVSAVTRGINGGRNGLDDRMSLYQQYSARTSAATLPASPMARRAPVSTAAPNIDQYTPAKPPELLTPIGSRERSATKVEVTVPMPISQNVSDRQIAQLATGGMGGNAK